MSSETIDIGYYTRRQRDSLTAARATRSQCARIVHHKLAVAYGLLADNDVTDPYDQPAAVAVRLEVPLYSAAPKTES